MRIVVILLFNFLMVSIVSSQDVNYVIKTITLEQYKKYFPMDIQDARIVPSNDVVYILPTHEQNKELQKEVIDFYRKTFIEGSLSVPSRSRVITDKEALHEDLSNTNIRTFGTVKGNLWTAQFFEKAKDFPIKIFDDSIVADKVYRGNNYVLSAAWYNPDNYKYSVVLIVPQHLEYAKYPWGRELTQYLIFQNEKEVTSAYYHLKDYHWIFSNKRDTMLAYKIELSHYQNDHFDLIDRALVFYKYPTLQRLSTCLISEKDIPIDTIRLADINKNFSNINDMSWLQPIAKQNKVIAIGESHHLKYNSFMIRRILFTINTFDYYSTLVCELPYSYAAYINYYLSVEDNKGASVFCDSVLTKIEKTKLSTYKIIRIWNQQHPSKKIRIGCSDVEHDYPKTIKLILNPYLRKVNSNADLKFTKADTLHTYLLEATQLMEKAKKQNMIGDYPFQTPEYMENVLENLKSTMYFRTHQKNANDHTERFKVMIRNVTDERFLGKQITSGKTMFWGGSDHFKIFGDTLFDKNAFKTEGYYLAHYFKPTKEKVYAIRLDTKAFSIEDSTQRIDPRLNFNLETNLLNLYKQRKIRLNEPVLGWYASELDEYIYRLSYTYPEYAIRIKNFNLENIQNLNYGPYERYHFLLNLKNISNYNTTIMIPYSPIGD